MSKCRCASGVGGMSDRRKRKGGGGANNGACWSIGCRWSRVGNRRLARYNRRMLERPDYLIGRFSAPQVFGETCRWIHPGESIEWSEDGKRTGEIAQPLTLSCAVAPVKSTSSFARNLSQAGVRIDGAIHIWLNSYTPETCDVLPGHVIQYSGRDYTVHSVDEYGGKFCEVVAVLQDR